ncbi:MAG: hypothetical protein B7X34_06730 [Acidobacteriia bacterium 12-62-4]|nr:MAG: hypothetical protein B7X34_06730 [Acidobacteriia bacterium 12-62-4]
MMRILTVLLLLSSSAAAEVVDRIVATVGRRVITASSVRQQIRVAALLDGAPAEESYAAFEAMRDRLIDRLLILEEMRISRYAIPEGGEVQPALDREIKDAGGPAKWAELLTRYRVTEEHIRLSLRYQAAIVRFTLYRFRPAVQIGPDQIRTYYEQRLPAQPKPAFEEVRDQIEAVLRREQINGLLTKWLAEVRQQTHIETYEELKP